MGERQNTDPQSMDYPDGLPQSGLPLQNPMVSFRVRVVHLGTV